MENVEIKNFWKNKKVIITGSTGFKGSWLSVLLNYLKADVVGIGLQPITFPSLHKDAKIDQNIQTNYLDVTCFSKLLNFLKKNPPDIIFHLAAQPLVRYSYEKPLETWNTNVMGTANLLESVRIIGLPCTVINVTTDKVYENKEWDIPYRENDNLGGADPYSSSKASVELLTNTWRNLYRHDGSPVKIATARAGNVIGGGDWATDRIVPDIIRAVKKNEPLVVRNQLSIRPWQHVLEPLYGYLLLAKLLYEKKDNTLETAFNFGPENESFKTVAELCEEFNHEIPFAFKSVESNTSYKESNNLTLSIDKAKKYLNWYPKLSFNESIQWTAAFYKQYLSGVNTIELIHNDIKNYLNK